MSSGSEWAEGWDPSSQQCPFIAVLLITTAGWATDDGKEEETNKSNKIPFSCWVPFLWKAGRHLIFMGARAPCSGWGGDGKPRGGLHLLLGWERQLGTCTTSPHCAAIPNSMSSLRLYASTGLCPCQGQQCSSGFWLSWGHGLCWNSWGPHRGGMVTLGLGEGSAPGSCGHWCHECGWIPSFLKAQYLNEILGAVSHSL